MPLRYDMLNFAPSCKCFSIPTVYGSDWIPAEYRRLGLAQFPTGMTSPAHKSSNTGSERVWRVSQCNAKYE